jgi:glutathione S-transferase
MNSFELFGTLTSPFVRRVRVVALEKNIPFTLVDTATPDGQARLRALSPVWKVPTARFADGLVVWDSRVILDVLTRDSWAPLRQPPTDPAGRVDEENVTNAIDEALLALIRLFYLQKDGFPTDAPPHKKDRQRADNLLGFVASRVRNDRFVGATAGGQGFGRAELALATTLDWTRFRKMADVDRWPALARFEAAWADRPLLKETRPR